ncbi:MAG: MBL fold metallo-hydrolase, partial [Candidatus Polarisedimenticolia bacterium]
PPGRGRAAPERPAPMEPTLRRFEDPRWRANSWLLAERDGGGAVVIDSGGPLDGLLAEVRARRLRVTHVLNTHHHFDHTAGNRRLAEATSARVCAHLLDAPLIDGPVEPLEDGGMVTSGGLRIRVLHIPGHTAGQAAFLADDRICFTGDTLFRGSVGSTIAPGHTSFDDLRRSLRRLLALPDAVQVAPGHALPSSIGEERAANPFLRVLEGRDPEGTETAVYEGRPVRLVVLARDYDGGSKAWVRFEDGTEATVPGSRIRRASA